MEWNKINVNFNFNVKVNFKVNFKVNDNFKNQFQKSITKCVTKIKIATQFMIRGWIDLSPDRNEKPGAKSFFLRGLVVDSWNSF